MRAPRRVRGAPAWLAPPDSVRVEHPACRAGCELVLSLDDRECALWNELEQEVGAQEVGAQVGLDRRVLLHVARDPQLPALVALGEVGTPFDRHALDGVIV